MIVADVMDAATDVIVLAALTEQNPQKRREKSNKTKKQPRDELGVAFYGADYGARLSRELRAQSFAGKTRPPEEFSTPLLLLAPNQR